MENGKMNRKVSRRRNGFSLVEVLVAMSLLGVVMVAIMSLFFLAQRNVYSGRQMTKAIALGNRVLEDLSLITKQDVYLGSFGLADTDSGSSVTILGKTYANARVRSTKATLIASPPSDIQTQTTGGPDFLTKWNTQMGTDLADGSVTLVLQPQPDSAATTFAAGTVMRMTVIIQWKEAARQRSLILTSMKAY